MAMGKTGFNVSRRWFIGGAASFGAFGGCRFFAGNDSAGGTPNVTFGVVSDIHIVGLAAPGDDERKANGSATRASTA